MSAVLNHEEGALVDVGWFLAYIGDLQVVYMDGRVDEPSYARYVRAVGEHIDARAPNAQVGVVYHVPEPSALSAKRRTMLGNALKQREAVLARTTTAFALATGSAVVRGGLRVLYWIAPPPYKNAVVATPRAAFEFVAPHHPGTSAEALTRVYESLQSALMLRMNAP